MSECVVASVFMAKPDAGENEPRAQVDIITGGVMVRGIPVWLNEGQLNVGNLTRKVTNKKQEEVTVTDVMVFESTATAIRKAVQSRLDEGKGKAEGF